MLVDLEDNLCWNQLCKNFSAKHLGRCKYDLPLEGGCECQFEISFKSDSVKTLGSPPWESAKRLRQELL